jgi:hypothetical protein
MRWIVSDSRRWCSGRREAPLQMIVYARDEVALLLVA